MQKIVQAKINEGGVIMPLLYEAIGDIAKSLSGFENEKEILNQLEIFYRMNSRLGYKNIWVYKDDERIKGAILLYAYEDLEILDAPIIAHLKSLKIDKKPAIECFEGEFYIDSIAVFKEFRGQGCAAELINFACDLAKEKDARKLSLIVSEKKNEVRKFYERLGFRCDKVLTLGGHKYLHMVKTV